LLQSAYSDYQIRPFENLHRSVKNTPLVILGARLKDTSNIRCASLAA
jgi:hypothetical protein